MTLHIQHVLVTLAFVASCGRNSVRDVDRMRDAATPEAMNPRHATNSVYDNKPVALSMSAARDVVTKWIDARDRVDFAAYSDLYADRVSHKPGWKDEQKALFDRRQSSVAVSLDEYYVDDNGDISVVFVPFAFDNDEGEVRALLIGNHGGAAKIISELTQPKASSSTGVSLGMARGGINHIFPKGFTSLAVENGGRCNDDSECNPSLLLGSDSEIEIPLGIFRNSPIPEDHDWGEYKATLQVIPLAAEGPLNGSVFVVVENRDSKNFIIARRGTLIGKAPEHRVLWTGDLLTFAKGKRIKYKLKTGEVIDQHLPESSTETAIPCRLSVLTAEKSTNSEIFYSCGLAPAIRVQLR